MKKYMVDLSKIVINHEGRLLSSVRYPMYCVSVDGIYDSEKPISFEEACDILENDFYATIVVLDSFDLAYLGYFDSEDLGQAYIEEEL